MIEKVEMYQAVCDRCGRTEEQMFGSISNLTYVMIWRQWHSQSKGKVMAMAIPNGAHRKIERY